MGAGVPTDLAGAMAYAANQQRVVKRTLTRTLIGFFMPLILVGGLIVVGFVVVDKVAGGIENPFTAGSGPDAPVQGVVGTSGEVVLGDNTYEITVTSATAQPGAAWGSIFASTTGGFLVVELSLTSTDTNSAVTQISWYDWKFEPDSAEPLEGALIAGGYEPLLSTLNLQPQETATGLVAFDTTASAGTLSLTDYDGTWAEWPITATVPSVITAELGVAVHPEVGQAPFTVTVAAPRWLGAGDPASSFDPASGSYLVLDVAVVLDEGALGETSSLSIGYDNWQFTPNGGTAVASDFGVSGANSLNFSTGQPTAANTLIAFDTAVSPGTLSLVNGDGSVLASWIIP